MNEEQERESELNPQLKAFEADYFLDIIVSVVHTTDIEIGITLNVNGLVVSGQLISVEIYFRELSEGMNLATTNTEAGNAVINAFKEAFRSLSDQAISSGQDRSPDFIHLRNAIVYSSGNTEMPISLPLWRGKLSSVDGFSLGESFIKRV